MTKPIDRDAIYRGRCFSAETIELCVRWYTTYRLSYRDLAAMMAERGVIVAHTTIMRWVLRYVPEYERRWARFARPPGSSWRMDETAVCLSVAVGTTYFERWTRMESPSGLCSAIIAIGSLRRHFSVQLSPTDGSHGLPRSTSMGTRQHFEVCDCLETKITVGGKWKCAHADI